MKIASDNESCLLIHQDDNVLIQLAQDKKPGNDIVACTALAAAGAQLLLFTTGRGTPLGGPVPTVKIASNEILASQKPHWIDYTARPILNNESTAENYHELIKLVLNLADGSYKSRNETNDYREISIYKQGVTL